MKCLVIFFNKPITELQYKILKKSSCAKIQLSFSVPFPYENFFTSCVVLYTFWMEFPTLEFCTHGKWFLEEGEEAGNTCFCF